MHYVADWAHDDVLPVTNPIEGDVSMTLGDVPVHLVFLGHSHTETLYAYHFPRERAVYAPDTAFVRTMPPFGLPDHYYPGYIRALDRIGALDFDALVPSHFGLGKKADLLAYRQMLVDYREAATRIVNEMGGNPSRGAGQRARIGPAYMALKAKYGDWHGFDAMFLPHFFGGIGGAYLGY
jgi:glyoxylase-like metal-dependent hydrolase (beta-lactamase superfamily II)